MSLNISELMNLPFNWNTAIKHQAIIVLKQGIYLKDPIKGPYKQCAKEILE